MTDRAEYLARTRARLIAIRDGEAPPPSPPVAAPTFRRDAPATEPSPPEPPPTPLAVEAASTSVHLVEDVSDPTVARHELDGIARELHFADLEVLLIVARRLQRAER